MTSSLEKLEQFLFFLHFGRNKQKKQDLYFNFLYFSRLNYTSNTFLLYH